MFNSAKTPYSWTEDKALEDLLNNLTDESRQVVESHPGIWPGIKNALKRWGRVQIVYAEISKPRSRRKILAALEETSMVVSRLWPLFEKASNYRDLSGMSGLYRYTGTTNQAIHFIKELKPDGGPTPQLPIAACAEELCFWFRENLGGRHHWKTIHEIIKYWFRQDAPRDTKELVNRRSPKWWKQFKTRTGIGEKPPELFWEIRNRRDQKRRELLLHFDNQVNQLAEFLGGKHRKQNKNRRRKSPKEKRLESNVRKAGEALNEFDVQLKRQNQKVAKHDNAHRYTSFERICRRKKAEEKRRSTLNAKSQKERAITPVRS